MDTSERTPTSDTGLTRAALLVALGALLSGPVGMALAALHPQPAWQGAETYAANFHPVQQAPFWFGFLLVGGCLSFVARAALLAKVEQRARALVALLCTGAFAAMIFVNYTLQVAVVPYLARAHDPAVAYLVMANPGALSWALEMFGYGVFGVATWLIAPFFEGRLVRALLVANGVVSVLGAGLTGANLAWVHSTAGLISFAAWNVLLIATMVVIAARYAPRPVVRLLKPA